MSWSEISDPKEGVSYYTHTTLETPLGKAILEWKGWKEYPSYSVTIDGEYISEEYGTIDEAKEKVREYLTEKLNQLSTFLSDK